MICVVRRGIAFLCVGAFDIPMCGAFDTGSIILRSAFNIRSLLFPWFDIRSYYLRRFRHSSLFVWFDIPICGAHW